MIAINLDDDEDLIGVELTDGNSEIIWQPVTVLPSALMSRMYALWDAPHMA